MFQKGHIDDFGADQGILARVHSGNVPSTWRVFHISRIKLIALIISFCFIIGLLMGFLAIYFIVNFDHHPLVPSNALFIIYIVISIFIVCTILLSIFIWINMKNAILVLTPEELIRGNVQQSKKILHIHYQEIAEIYVTGNIVMIVLKKGDRREQKIDCRLFEPSAREVVASLITAYENFKEKTSGNKRIKK